MKTDLKAFLVSLLLHLAIVGTAVSFAAMPLKQDKPILIDFTIDSGQDQKDAGRKADIAEPPAKSVEAAVKQRVPDQIVSPRETSVPVETSADATPVFVPVVKPQPQLQQVQQTQSGTPAVSGLMAKNLDSIGHGKAEAKEATGNGTAARQDSAEALRMMYLKKNFTYIRDLIAGNTRYPGLARRMGWNGKLAVEFIVQRDGRADSVRIVRSSGVPLLDSDAMDTVMRSAPFPKPPVSARLIIPLEYRLEN